MEYIVGPVLALLLGAKFSAMHVQQRTKQLEERINLIDQRLEDMDTKVVENSMKIMMPLANATRRIQEQLGM